MMRIAVLDDYQGVALRLADWASLAPRAAATAFTDHLEGEDALAERLAPFAAVVAMRERTAFPATLLARLPQLKLLVTAGQRNAAIDVAAATRLGIQVCGTEMLPYPTAELTWGLILALARHIPAEDRALREGRWQTTLGIGLKGKTLGIVGLGRLGQQVAAVGRTLGMEVIAWSQNLTAVAAQAAGATLVAKSELFARADVVSIHLVLSERSRGIVGAAELAAMKPTAFLVNTARGPIVGEAALAAALAEHRIAGAALDVFEPEPLPPDHPFRGLDNLLLTPHLGYVTAESYRLVYGQAVAAIQGFLDGAALRPLNRIG